MPKTAAIEIAYSPDLGAEVLLCRLIRWTGRCIVLLLPAALAGVGLKWQVVLAGEILTFGEKLTFIRGDLLTGFFMLPLGLALVTWFFPKRIRLSLVALAGIAALAVELLQSLCFAYVGKFLPWELARDFVPGHDSPAGVGLALGAILGTGWVLGKKLAPDVRFTPRFRRMASGIVARNAFAALLVLYGLTALTWAVPATGPLTMHPYWP